jgi:hypothetical protein
MPVRPPESPRRAVPYDDPIVSIVITNMHDYGNVPHDRRPRVAITLMSSARPHESDLRLDIASMQSCDAADNHDLFKPSRDDTPEQATGVQRAIHRELADYSPYPLPTSAIRGSSTRSGSWSWSEVEGSAAVEMGRGAHPHVHAGNPRRRRLRIGLRATAVAILAGLAVLLSTRTSDSSSLAAAPKAAVATTTTSATASTLTTVCETNLWGIADFALVSADPPPAC